MRTKQASTKPSVESRPMNSRLSFAAAALLVLAFAAPSWAQQTPSQRIVIRAPQSETSAPASSAADPVPEQLPPAYFDAPTRIEQVRHGRRITEVVVTPRGYSHSYSMANPELGPLKNGPGDNGAGLSVPRFVRFSF